MAVVGWVLAVVLGGVGAVAAHLVGFGDLGVLIAGQAGLWTGMLATCWFVSHRYGTGDLGQDYRLAFWKRDAGWGLLLSVIARAGSIAVTIPIVLVLRDDLSEVPRQLPVLDHNAANVITVLAFLVIGAPLIEELFFRGLVQRALETVLPAAAAIGLQAVLFAAVHAIPGAGVANAVLIAQVFVGGVVFGVAAWKWHRLGPAIAAHACFNALPAIAIALGG
jgi:membrane protease YdiL (CAAX protease family)